MQIDVIGGKFFVRAHSPEKYIESLKYDLSNPIASKILCVDVNTRQS